MPRTADGARSVEVRAVEGGVRLMLAKGNGNPASVTLTVTQARSLGRTLMKAAEAPGRRLMFSALERLANDLPTRACDDTMAQGSFRRDQTGNRARK